MNHFPKDTLVYRAVTKSQLDKNFRLRPTEDSLSVALTSKKAMGSLTCKGWAELTVGAIENIEPLIVQPKRFEADTDLLEVMGLPLSTEQDEHIQSYALSLAKIVVRTVML